MDPDFEHRIFLLTDAQPNMGDVSGEGLLDLMREASSK